MAEFMIRFKDADTGDAKSAGLGMQFAANDWKPGDPDTPASKLFEFLRLCIDEYMGRAQAELAHQREVVFDSPNLTETKTPQ